MIIDFTWKEEYACVYIFLAQTLPQGTVLTNIEDQDAFV